MAVLAQNPFETSFENLTNKAAGGVKQVKKVAADAVTGLVKDTTEGLTSNVTTATTNPAEVKQKEDEKQNDREQKVKQELAQTRQNLEQINAAVRRAREDRLKKEQEAMKVKEQEKQAKLVEERKKNEEPAWKKMLKGKMGSREQAKNAGG